MFCRQAGVLVAASTELYSREEISRRCSAHGCTTVRRDHWRRVIPVRSSAHHVRFRIAALGVLSAQALTSALRLPPFVAAARLFLGPLRPLSNLTAHTQIRLQATGSSGQEST